MPDAFTTRSDLNGPRAGGVYLLDRMTIQHGGGDDRRDQELIARWKGGDERAATELVERHASALARFAVSSGERNEVDELVQDTFVRAFNSLDGFRGESSFRTWLFTIERRLLLDRRRAEKRRRDRTESQEGDAATEYDALDSRGGRRDAEAKLQRSGAAAVADAARSVQPSGGRRVVVQGNRRSGGTTEGAARVHYHNAMRAVKEFLDE